MQPVALQSLLISRLREDLVGPHKIDEIFEGVRLRPSDIYLTGILWPPSERMGAEDDDRSEGDDEDDDSSSVSSLIGQQRPCSMGISFCLSLDPKVASINILLSFATYNFDRVEVGGGDKAVNLRWTRKQHAIAYNDFAIPENSSTERVIATDDPGLNLILHLRSRKSAIGRLVTLTLINKSVSSSSDRNSCEALALFQCGLEISPANGSTLIPRPPRPSAYDEDEESGRLLYRNTPEFATGHVCSVSWECVGKFASKLKSEWVPEAAVTAFSENGADVFHEIVGEGLFDAAKLANSDKSELTRRLRLLPSAYARWIETQKVRISELGGDLQPVAERHISNCEYVCARIQGGIDALEKDDVLLSSFKLANSAMSLQHQWKSRGKGGALKWRPFQLGFILLCANSVCKSSAPDRDIFDLLWFPTGGGKTEAYLALVAMLAFYRRGTQSDPDAGAGNAALMRYTLRLLTAQQFERASALVLACELVRRGTVKGVPYPFARGTRAFSIGLWVGGDATPNTFFGEKGALATRGNRGGTTAEQLSECPCCSGRVAWNYDEVRESVQPYCSAETCSLGQPFGLWPVFTVDEDLYRERPTLVIGTIDKFALITTKREVAELFGFDFGQGPDLIIQDELHLISGPLGTIAGIYETAFDWLVMREGRRAKIIGSTATIRRASEQVRALFCRESCQFPPPGLDHDDSGFAVRDEYKAPRKYLAVSTAGRSAKFSLQAAAGSLLQSCGKETGIPDDRRDGYSTLLAYFNSLRELGGAIVQMLDDVPDSLKLYASQHAELPRVISAPKELTSRVSQKEIVEILGDLKIPCSNLGSIDSVLATNMVSVGVDVARLGLMIVNGQPKTRAEYIQATSRVGRSSFPGLIVSILNSAKPRDRSHFETFCGWHGSLYKDVEATSVTPFASRARDRALHAALVSMIRHRNLQMKIRPDLTAAPSSYIMEIVNEIERRVGLIDIRELDECASDINKLLEDWEARAPTYYNNPKSPNKSLLISADVSAQRIASGRLPFAAWPTMNNMRSVEANTRFRMAEALKAGGFGSNESNDTSIPNKPRWRQ